MLTWKKYALTFALGFAAPIALALYCGGEAVAVAGFKLAAIENGFQLAARDWHVDGVPAHEVDVARWEEPSPAPAKPKKVARGR